MALIKEDTCQQNQILENYCAEGKRGSGAVSTFLGNSESDLNQT